MSWLIVAKMPLLISSRMMSAGLTPSSSASSLTVIVPGSSIAPRSRGSSDLDAGRVERAVATRRLARARAGRGCRSYSWPRAPPSIVVFRLCQRSPVERRRAGRAGSGVSSARPRAPFVDRLVEAVGRRGTGTRRGRPPAGLVDRRRRRPGSGRSRTSSRFGRAVRQATQVRVGTRRGAAVLAAAGYDATSSAAASAGLLRGAASAWLARRRRRRSARRRRRRPRPRSRRPSSVAASAWPRRVLGASAPRRRPARRPRRSASARPRPRRCLGARLRLGALGAGSAAASAAPRPRPPARRRVGLGRGIGGGGLRLGDRDVAADVDPPAGQPGGEPGVLALAADRQREHPLGDGHVRDPVLLVDVDAR